MTDPAIGLDELVAHADRQLRILAQHLAMPPAAAGGRSHSRRAPVSQTPIPQTNR